MLHVQGKFYRRACLSQNLFDVHLIYYRQRREARIRENYDRIFASLINPDSAKFAARHPTRVIPDVPGIFGLSKGEVKKDTKEIDKCSTFAVSFI